MKLRRALRRIAHRLGVLQPDLDRARNRFDHFHHRAVEQNKLRAKAKREALRHERAGRRLRARYWRGVERRAGHRAGMASGRAQYWLGQIKPLAARKAGLEKRRDDLERELREWIREHGVTISGNTVRGGTAKQRVRAALLQAALNDSRAHNRFYSQPGYFTPRYGLTGEPRGARSDCSQFLISIAYCANTPDPAGGGYNDGFTGSFVANCQQISEAEMKRIGVGIVVFGYGNGFHCEGYTGPGDKTVGHGDSRVNAGTIDMIGGYKRFYRWPGT